MFLRNKDLWIQECERMTCAQDNVHQASGFSGPEAWRKAPETSGLLFATSSNHGKMNQQIQSLAEGTTWPLVVMQD